MKKVFLMLVLVWKKGLAIWLFPPIFNNLVLLLDTSVWPTKYVAMFGEKEIVKLSQYFEVLLQYVI